MKKLLTSLLVVVSLMIMGTTAADASTRTYRFFYYSDEDNSGTITIGDICLRDVAMRYSAQMTNGIWMHTNFTISGTPYDFITSTSELNSCKQTGTGNITLAVGKLHKLQDLEGHGSIQYFTPTAGSGTVYYGLRYNDGDM